MYRIDSATEGRLSPERAVAGAPCSDRCRSCSVRRFAICDAVPPEELEQLSASVTVKALRAHEILFLEGEPAAYLFILKTGVLKLYKQLRDGRQQVTGFAFGGDLIGLSVRECHMVSAEAVTETSVCAMPRARMRKLITAFPELEERLLAVVSHELSLAQDQLLLLGRRSATERLASFLLLLSHRAAERGQPTNPLCLPMGRSDIADYLGLSVETVSRSFTRLASDGVIRLINPYLVDVLRRNVLGAKSEGDGIN
jgi:CRP/FNR family transcriptional regulator, anaerobic regulatory protein